jgi:hypothetical protein
MNESGDVLKATVGEGSPVVAFCRRDPAEYTAQTVVVVVADEAG